MAKMGDSIGKMRSGGLSSRSPKDRGDVSVKPKSGAVISTRKANNKMGGKKGKC